MRRQIALSAVLAVLAAFALAVPAAARTSLECRGDASVMPVPESFDVRTSGNVTVTSFDFTGTHSLCDRTGQRVEGTWSGHLKQIALPDGRTLVFIAGHEIYAGATVDVASVVEIAASGEWRVVATRASNGTGWLDGASTDILEVTPLGAGLLAFRSVITWAEVSWSRFTG